MKPWDRRPDETDQAWTAFVTYRDAGPGRNIRDTTKATGKAPSTHRQLALWSSKHDWVQRVRAYDAWLDQEVQARVLQAAGDRAMEQVRLGEKLRKKAEARIDALKVDDLASEDVPRWAKVGVEIERLAMGDATSRTDVTSGGEPIHRVLGFDPSGYPPPAGSPPPAPAPASKGKERKA